VDDRHRHYVRQQVVAGFADVRIGADRRERFIACGAVDRSLLSSPSFLGKDKDASDVLPRLRGVAERQPTADIGLVLVFLGDEFVGFRIFLAAGYDHSFG